MRTIILDTNFLVSVFQFKIDLRSELDRICNFKYQLKIIDKTVGELKKILGKNKRYAVMALDFLKRNEVERIVSKEDINVDDSLVECSGDAIIATQDRELKKRLKGQFIVVRQKKYLMIDG